jgi:hypothetical protein
VKQDYFLEDPYEPLRTDRDQDGTDPYVVSIDDGTGLARVTYYIDGNLWIHNKQGYSFQIETTPGTGTQVTFLVRGNVYLSDNLRLQDTAVDGVAFMAVKDPAVPDSGNVYLGDPRYGSLRELHAFLYAENDFYDLNIDEKGSKDIRLLGAMTAGDQVLIERDYGGRTSSHSRLQVDWDPRMRDGSLSLPFVADQAAAGGAVTLEAWAEASPDAP